MRGRGPKYWDNKAGVTRGGGGDYVLKKEEGPAIERLHVGGGEYGGLVIRK
jgi:hypothetical protein